MSLFVSSLNSGSNGNCYYVGTVDESVLIDAGISPRETVRRMKKLGLSIQKVRAIFVTHEHSDHIQGVPGLSKKFNIPVYITEQTLKESRLNLKDELVNSFQPHLPVRIGNLSVTAFPKQHDATDPHSFIVSSDTVNVGIFTDIGSPDEPVIRHFEQCHAAFLESNYDIEMLDSGTYPLPLKNRIREGKGHLSNLQALQLFINHRPSYMSHLFLSHLSQNNNSPKIVKELFSKIAGQTQIIVAPRYKATPLYHIRNSYGRPSRNYPANPEEQLSLF